jgi:hypothetical protein
MKPISFNYPALIVLVTLNICLSSCGISKRMTDVDAIRFARKNPELVREAAVFSVSATLNKTETSFSAANISDPGMRKKIKKIGNTVDVFYGQPTYDEIKDSCVVFSIFHLSGISEIIYDFATWPRNVTIVNDNRQSYYFTKVAERIYYRRRPIPMM